MPLSTAAAQHVQPCFTAERRVSEQVEADATVEELVAIDLQAAFAAELEAVKAGNETPA